MDINGWNYWMNNREISKMEYSLNEINIKGLNKKELLEFKDLENQHDEQKPERKRTGNPVYRNGGRINPPRKMFKRLKPGTINFPARADM
ncbi:MAG: hypothetical protein GX045_07705 [Clostridiaceae bacterium]|jgi:hypothetical protein|nr:hypothetical protein [Clostridiaceae bacterium]